MQQPPYPATTSSMRSRRSGRSLMALALGVSGAASLPAFLMPFKTGASEQKAICTSLGARRRDSHQRPAKQEDAHFSNHCGSKESRRSAWFDWRSVKSHSPSSFTSYFTIHFTWTQQVLLREINALHVAARIDWYAAQTVDEAGATPPFAARCVSGSWGRSRLVTQEA